MTSEDARAWRGRQVLPFYVVADQSRSMEGPKIASLNEGLQALVRAVFASPATREKVHLGVLAFSDSAEWKLELCRLAEGTYLDRLTAAGATSYRAAFGELYARLPRDVEDLKGKGFQVHRPTVVFLSDGMPTDGDWRNDDPGEAIWGPVLDRLQAESFRYRPNILAFGIENAPDEVIKRVASKPGYAFKGAEGIPPALIEGLLMDLTRSIITSSTVPGLTGIAIRPAGFIPLEI